MCGWNWRVWLLCGLWLLLAPMALEPMDVDTLVCIEQSLPNPFTLSFCDKSLDRTLRRGLFPWFLYLILLCFDEGAWLGPPSGPSPCFSELVRKCMLPLFILLMTQGRARMMLDAGLEEPNPWAVLGLNLMEALCYAGVIIFSTHPGAVERNRTEADWAIPRRPVASRL